MLCDPKFDLILTMFHVLLRICILLFLNVVHCIYVRYNWFVVWFKPSISLLIFWLVILSTIESEVLKSQTINVESLCSFFHYILFNIHNTAILITSQTHFFFLSQIQKAPVSLNVQLNFLFVLDSSSRHNYFFNSGFTHPVFDFSHRSLCFSSYSSLS